MISDLKRLIHGVKLTEWGCRGTNGLSPIEKMGYVEVCTLDGDTYTIGQYTNGWLVTDIFSKTRDDSITVEYIYPAIKYDLLVRIDSTRDGDMCSLGGTIIKEGPITSHMVKRLFRGMLYDIAGIWGAFDSIFKIAIKRKTETSAVIHLEGIVNHKGLKYFDSSLFKIKRKSFRRCKLAYVKKKAIKLSREDFFKPEDDED